jgi:hypothetical protein
MHFQKKPHFYYHTESGHELITHNIHKLRHVAKQFMQNHTGCLKKLKFEEGMFYARTDHKFSNFAPNFGAKKFISLLTTL